MVLLKGLKNVIAENLPKIAKNNVVFLPITQIVLVNWNLDLGLFAGINENKYVVYISIILLILHWLITYTNFQVQVKVHVVLTNVHLPMK